MKKLSLDIGELRVDSFEAEGRESGRGTVQGHAWTLPYCTRYDYTCNGYGTCGIYPCKQVP